MRPSGGSLSAPALSPNRTSAAAPERPPTLTAEGLSHAIGSGRLILDGISLDLASGERLAVVGPNGAGKTTLLRILAGLLKPSAGRVSLDGQDLARLPVAERARRVAVVAQAELPDPRLTLGDYVALGRLPHLRRTSDAEHRRILAEALDRLGLSGLVQMRLGELSGGERQRGAIARAIAQAPTLLILDEPTNHLDPRARADVLAALRDLGATVVAALHDLALADGFADRVAVMAGGRLVGLDRPLQALAPDRVRQVFAMDSFRVRSPTSGREIVVLEAPLRTPSADRDFRR